MFIVALFIVTKTWKQSGCPLTGGWVNRQWYIQTMQYYPVILKKERNEISSHNKTWRNLKSITVR